MFKKPLHAMDGWSDLFTKYNDTRYEKIISEQEYNNAIKTVEKYNKPDKKKKKSKKEIKAEEALRENGLLSEENNDKNKVIFEMPASSSPLLTLPISINYLGKEIQQGFYLVNSINEDNHYFIRLTEGQGRHIADIEAYATEVEGDIITAPEVFMKFVDDEILKLSYRDRDILLEAYLTPVAN